jgi:uncharacterized phage-associated protein
MSLTALHTSEWMLARAIRDGEPLTNLKLQKLIYIANGWHLSYFDEVLFDEQIEAWTYGPVVPSIYHLYKQYGSFGINDVGCMHWFSASINSLLETVWEAYANISAVKLVAMTHRPGTPWSETFKEGSGKGDVIPTDLIRKHFRELAAKYGSATE